ncbi:MAG: hypothetical protein CMQ13_02850 [Gammaproteobacteria bacterium]|nr:hypothetical protein [Gammaproteobacteria bacterium]
MSLVVNTNVSSLTAQRALAYADSLQGEAMQRLSTGSKINSASDDAAGLAIAQRMTAQVNGLNMAVKNANDGISLTQSVEGALVEVADMLQRLRELSVQAANDTNTDIDRSAIQEEVNLLVAEISRVSSNTRFNNQLVLDGSFTNRQIQVGTEGGEEISITLESTSANALGAFEVTGDVIAATGGAGNGVKTNATDDADDLIINGNSVSRTVGVSLADSAKNVAANINAVSGETGVSAAAKTYAVLYNEYAADQTYSLKINNVTTGDFVISSTSVSDAIDKINAISGSTGVTASSTSDNKVRLYSSDGSDMTIENEKALTNLRVKTIKHDGITAQDQVSVNAIKTDGVLATGTFFVRNASTGVNTSFATGSTHNQHEYSTLINNALGTDQGTAGIRVTSATAASFSTGTYYLKQESTGHAFKLSVSNGNTAAEWQDALTNAVRFGGDFDGEGKNLTERGDITVSLAGGDVQFVGDQLFGDFNIYSDATLNTDISDQNHANHKVGVEGTGILVTTAAGTDGVDSDAIATAVTADANGDITLNGTFASAAIGSASGQVYTMVEAQKVSVFTNSDESANSFTITGTNRDGSTISETIAGGTGALGNTINAFKTVTAVDVFATATGVAGASVGSFFVGIAGTSDTVTYKGAREFGDFDIATSATATVAAETGSTTTGDADSKDLALAAAAGDDTATVQGTISLKSSKIFSVTQSGTEEAVGSNDNYFTTQASSLNTVSNIDLRSQSGASLAIATLDGAIEKISSMRSDLGAIENRLDHTVNNLMNVAEQTESARSRIQDADFASESAKLAKAQVLKQAGVGMLAQANASSQLVLQLLQ